jgi:hypothetical protein
MVHPFFLAVTLVVLLLVFGPVIAIVAVVVLGRSKTAQPGFQLSGDGLWWWNGQQWISTLSEDGRWRWDGRTWQPVQTHSS